MEEAARISNCAAGVVVGKVGVWTLLIFAATPLLWKVLRVYSQSRPESAPPGYAFWPLWYAAWAFSLTRLAGGLFVLGIFTRRT